jgi:hypothetical protein
MTQTRQKKTALRPSAPPSSNAEQAPTRKKPRKHPFDLAAEIEEEWRFVDDATPSTRAAAIRHRARKEGRLP